MHSVLGGIGEFFRKNWRSLNFQLSFCQLTQNNANKSILVKINFSKFLGYPAGLTKTEAEKRLHELCMKNLDSLAAANLVSLDNELRLISNEPGRLMARYSIAFETIKKFTALSGQETLSDLVNFFKFYLCLKMLQYF